MKVFLLHRDRDFQVKPGLRDDMFAAMLSGNLYALNTARRNLERKLRTGAAPPPGADDALAQDLELEVLWEAMAAGDEFLYEMARRAVLSSLSDPEEIVYRQRVLADCLEHPATVEEMYALAIEALAAEREVGSMWSGARPAWILQRSVRLLTRYVDVLRRLRRLADEHAPDFRSEGFARFFAMLREELADDYLRTVERHLDELRLERGVLESARLGPGDKARGYVVHVPPPPDDRGWWERLRAGRAPQHSFEIHPRDQAGHRAIEDIRAQGLNHVANAVAQSADHVKSFFTMLRLELAFYLGCLNLRERLAAKGAPTCFPEPLPSGGLELTAEGVYDVCLSLHVDEPVVGNDLDADGRSLLMITGANQGGKSTFLRSLGLAQLMMQCGMLVGAHAFRAAACSGVHTHYKREEDAAMEGGKLDEELSRMSGIADRIRPGALLLCNESFASTNEREGSEIARQIVRVLLAKRVRVAFVTHMYDLAHGFHAERLPTALFLRAERERTFKLVERPPLPTSYGEDSYRRIFERPRAAGLTVRAE